MTPRDWLSGFGTALERGDLDSAVGVFEAGSDTKADPGPVYQ